MESEAAVDEKSRKRCQALNISCSSSVKLEAAWMAMA